MLTIACSSSDQTSGIAFPFLVEIMEGDDETVSA